MAALDGGGCAHSCARTAAAVRGNVLELLLLPLLVFAGLVGLSLGVTASSISASIVSDTERLQSVADAAAASLGSALAGALAPLLSVRSFLESNPGGAAHSTAQAYWASASAGLLASAPAAACLQLAPFGHVVAIVPLVSPALNLTGVLLQGGIDIFNGSGVPNYRPAGVQGLASRQLVLQGPLPVFACAGGACGVGVSSASALIARLPIFPPSAPTGGAWGDATWPGWQGAPLGAFAAVTNCSAANSDLLSAATGRSLCAANASGDGSQFWGFATAIISWASLLSAARVSSLGDAAGGGLLWSVARSPSARADGAAATQDELVVVGSDGGALPTAAYADGVFARVVVGNTLWVVTVQNRGGWAPPWRAGVYAACVVASALIAAAAFVHLLERRRHYDTLYAMLPARVLRAVLARGSFSEALPHVTVLFTDVVGWTTLAASIAPERAMAILNALFSDFDALAVAHGVQKVETIGDAFMAVVGASAGAPPPAAAQAATMARFALALVDAAAAPRHALPGGAPMRIRVGIACGPAIAGVVGQLLPHLSFFGDVVNTAARMESTSEPGRVQLTTPLAALLLPPEAAAHGAAAGAAASGSPCGGGSDFALIARGAIRVKGKGEMLTYWLERGDAAAARPPGVAAAVLPPAAPALPGYAPLIAPAAAYPAAAPAGAGALPAAAAAAAAAPAASAADRAAQVSIDFGASPTADEASVSSFNSQHALIGLQR